MEIRPRFANHTAPIRPSASASTLLLGHEPASVDPARDGLVGLYALRILDRGIDPRGLVAEHRSIRYGLNERSGRWSVADNEVPPVIAVGRSATNLDADTPRLTRPPIVAPARPTAPVRVRRLSLPSTAGLTSLLRAPVAPVRGPRRLVAASLVAAVMLGVGLLGALAQEQPATVTSAVKAAAALLTDR